MTFAIKEARPLATAFSSGSLYHHWLSGQSVLETMGARDELRRALNATPPAKGKAPLWQSEEFAHKLPPAWRDLPDGPDVVVTGQQPGFLGGPLLTLYKIATTIELAAKRSEAGRPTVPVFWSGDDDDDLAEALAPFAWDCSAEVLWQAPARVRLSDPKNQRAILATVSHEVWAEPITAALGGEGKLPAGLQAILAGETTWGIGQTNLIEAVFGDAPLVVVNGHDDRLHNLASPFYREIWAQREALTTLAGERGEALQRAGFHTQINSRSLAHNLFAVDDGQRRRLLPETQEPSAWDKMRPGVMLRSLVQDWLLQPRAVVVGPGEFAYLRQLDPLYEALSLERSPLIPRLSAWLAPEEDDGALTKALQIMGESSTSVVGHLAELADDVVLTAQRKMSESLVQNLKVSPERAEAMAASRGRRFRKGVLAMFSEEDKRRKKAILAELPPWLAPQGQPQERALGWISALDIWGANLVPAIMKAAAAHLAAGESDSWAQFALTTSEGRVSW